MLDKLKTNLILYSTKTILNIENFEILSNKAESDLEYFTAAEGFFKAYDTLKFTMANKRLTLGPIVIDSLKYFLGLSRQDSNYRMLTERKFYEYHIGKGIGKILGGS